MLHYATGVSASVTETMGPNSSLLRCVQQNQYKAFNKNLSINQKMSKARYIKSTFTKSAIDRQRFIEPLLSHKNSSDALKYRMRGWQA